MRIALTLALTAMLAVPATAGEEINEEVVKAVRAAISAKRPKERTALVDSLLARKDLDWASFSKGLHDGPYYQKPMVTAYGERGSGKDLNLRLRGADGKERGFSLWVPKAYDAKTPLPAIVYLHHGARVQHVSEGAERAGVALFKFRDVCEKHGIFFIAPYTSSGAEWWTPEGRRLVEWSIEQVKTLYNIDDDRVGLLGALDGADAVWYLGQEMPGTFSVLMPMTGDPYEITGLIRPLYLGTLDRMDILMGVPGKTNSTVGVKDHNKFLDGLAPMFGQRMRITATVWPEAQADFHYLENIKEQVASFVLDRKRKALAAEVDVETDHDDGLRSLWLRNDGYDPDGDVAPGFKTTRLKYDPPERKEPARKIGIGLEERDGFEFGLVVTTVAGATRDANVFRGDILLEVDGQRVKKRGDAGPLIQKHDWNEEVHLLLARDMRESELARARKREARHMKIRRKIEELRAQGKEVPEDVESLVPEEEDEPDAAEEEDEEPSIEIGEDEGDSGDDSGVGAGAPGRPKMATLVFERWVKIIRPVGEPIRSDFGLVYDRSFRKQGVKVGHVYPGSLADRSGFKAGDVIVQAGSDEVRSLRDLEAYFGDFKFEKEPEGERFVEFTVRKENPNGTWTAGRTVKASWEPRFGTRVDARWNKKENALQVLTRHSSGFTIWFTGEFVAPGEKFHLFINSVPYLDLVDPAGAPAYPRMGPHGGGAAGDRLYRMRRKRALVDGWQPDYRLALDEYFAHRDRKLIVAAKRSFDLTKFKEGFAKARDRGHGNRGKRWERIRKAYEEYKSKG